MADLLDIAPASAVETVSVDGQDITVNGLHGDAIASIVSRFPHLGNMLNGVDIGPKLIAQFGKAIGPIIAAGCGHLGEEKYEQHAATLLAEDQLKLIKPILGLTFPNGISAFVEALTTLLTGSGEAKPIRMRLKKSASPSPPLSTADSLPNTQ
jgi:hypothetical protein